MLFRLVIRGKVFDLLIKLNYFMLLVVRRKLLLTILLLLNLAGRVLVILLIYCYGLLLIYVSLRSVINLLILLGLLNLLLSINSLRYLLILLICCLILLIRSLIGTFWSSYASVIVCPYFIWLLEVTSQEFLLVWGWWLFCSTCGSRGIFAQSMLNS